MNMTEISIRNAAIKLISRVGYDAMSLRQLAKEANINSSTLYIYYKGKQELLMTLVLEYFERLSDAWDLQAPVDANASSKLKAFVAFHVNHHLANKDEAVLGNMELRSLDTEHLALVRKARRAYLGKVQKIIDQGVAQGQFRCDECKLMSRIIFGMLTQACAWYRDDGPMGLNEVTVCYTQLVLRMLGATHSSHGRT
ncbi:TetR/AcrR family transcriptional regulator [Pseudomonas sp. NPDC089569]|uniref:TetR/AcrR family transcriptional regulator n=1 Tax=Pseudomonas sp. NPDC089569 TaxID=3390722 RepID=UPI003D010D37